MKRKFYQEYLRQIEKEKKMNRIKTTRKQRFPRNRILDALGLPQCDPNSTLCVCGHRKQEHHIHFYETETNGHPELQETINCDGEDCDCDHFVGIRSEKDMDNETLQSLADAEDLE